MEADERQSVSRTFFTKEELLEKGEGTFVGGRA